MNEKMCAVHCAQLTHRIYNSVFYSWAFLDEYQLQHAKLCKCMWWYK